MSPITFRPAKRESVGLLIGLAGASGSGKTYTALRIATGLAGGKPFGFIDTEAGRALHYADQFQFDHAQLDPPFTPQAYSEAIHAADDAGYPVIVVDSASHEHAGDGGLLDMFEIEFERMGRRDAVKMSAWIRPKTEHKRFVSRMLQVHAHLILCFRAEEKIEIVKEGGKTVVRPKQSLVGLDGWIPVCEKNLPYELTLSFLLTPDAPGIPKPIKLQDQHRRLIPLDKPLDEQTGVELAKWAAGTASESSGLDTRVLELVQQINECADQLGNRSAVTAAIAKNRRAHAGDPATHVEWLEATLAAAEAKVAEAEQSADDDPFADLPPEEPSEPAEASS
jgi:hypothetical protein